jgi:hypothetical protein
MKLAENADGPNAEQTKVPPNRFAAGANGFLNIDVQLPPGYHLNSPSAATLPGHRLKATALRSRKRTLHRRRKT